MKNASDVLALFFICASSVAAQLVSDLTTDTIRSFINKHAVVMVEFFAPWCSVCTDLEPVYEAAASMLNPTKDVKFAHIDCTTEPSLCEFYRISIFPTLKVFTEPEEYEIYNGPREPKEMVLFTERRYDPLVSIQSMHTIEQFKSANRVAIVGFWKQGDITANATFTKVAKSYIDKYAFGAANDPDFAKSESVTHPSIVLYKQYDDRRVVFDGDFEPLDIASFIDHASFPLIGEFDRYSVDRYFHQDAAPFAGIFGSTAAQGEELARIIWPIAEKQGSKLRFATVDTTKYPEFTARFHLENDKYPAFAILDKENQKFPINQDINLTEDVVAQWVQDFLDEKLTPHFKSEPIPKLQTESVNTVVRNNFADLVLNSNNDVVLEFYAPWCKHCKELAPNYEQLARLYGKHDKQVIFAKVDATANDIPGHVIDSYPTIKLFPAKRKDAPLQYIGNRTIEDLAKFVEKGSANKVNVIQLEGGLEMISTHRNKEKAEIKKDEL